MTTHPDKIAAIMAERRAEASQSYNPAQIVEAVANDLRRTNPRESIRLTTALGQMRADAEELRRLRRFSDEIVSNSEEDARIKIEAVDTGTVIDMSRGVVYVKGGSV
jgi:hypothetical protein